MRAPGPLSARASKPARNQSALPSFADQIRSQPGVAATTIPRTVDHLEPNGLVDVFSLTEADIAEMGVENVIKHFEKAREAATRRTGAPQLPRAIRGKR